MDKHYTVRRLKIGRTEQMDALARAAGELYSQVVVWFWRTVCHKDLWLKDQHLMRWLTSTLLHAQTLGFVGEHVSHLPAGHLVDALVAAPSVSGALADIPDVADGDGLHACLMQRGDKVGGLLAQRIAQLVIQPA